MKHGKKLLALALALCMAFALAVPAFAADEITIGGVTLPGLPETAGDNNGTESAATHTYKVYQIFKGEYETIDDKGTLKDPTTLMAVKWGNGVDAKALVDALAGTDGKQSEFLTEYEKLAGKAYSGANPFAGIEYVQERSDTSADAVARKLAELKLDKNSLEARAFAEVVANHVGTAIAANDAGEFDLRETGPGYYLTVDEMSGPVGARSLYILELPDTTKPYKPTPKADVPELDKKVLETNDSDASKTDWNDTSADYDIGDKVPFVLTGTIADNYDLYKTYKYVFHDTLSEGLKFDFGTDDAQASKNIEVYLVNGTGDAATRTSIKSSATIEVENGKLTVTFADLKEIETVTATSTIQVVYTATLQEGAVVGGDGNDNEAYLEFSNDPNSTGDGETGTTPTDKVTVFTFKLIVNKVGEDEKPLSGAEFALYKNDPKLEYKEDGTTLNDVIIYTVKDGQGTKEVPYYLYSKDFVKSASTGEEPVEGSVFTIEGLDAGDYALVETKHPDGYNAIEDMFFTITAKETKVDGVTKITELKVGPVTDQNGNEMKAANGDAAITFAPTAVEGEEEVYNGDLSTNIVNLKGVILPGTGGIGTTIFYVVGGLLIAGAGVVLITKKRMKNAE